jgi:hypothetical protein
MIPHYWEQVRESWPEACALAALLVGLGWLVGTLPGNVARLVRAWRGQ